jgi:ATP-binding cassette subfamily B protein
MRIRSISGDLHWWWHQHASSGGVRMPVIIFLGGVAGVSDYIEAAIVGQAINVVIASRSLWDISVLAIILIATALLSAAATAALGLLADNVGLRARAAVWGAFLQAVFDSPSPFFDRAHSGRLLRTAVAGTDAAFDLWSAAARAYIPSVLGVTVLIPACVWLNWRMAVALVSVGFVCSIISALTLQRSYRAQKKLEQMQASAAVLAADLLAHAPLVRAFGMAQRETNAVRATFEKVRAGQLRVACLWAFAAAASRTASAAAVLAMLLVGAALHAADEATIGEVVAFLGFAGLAAARIEMLLHGAEQAAQRLPLIGELAGIAGAATQARETWRPDNERLPAADPRRGVSITVEDVHFAYPDGPSVLRGIDLHLANGEAVAVVGASGAGKSTLFSLILGLRRPQNGRILVDGEDLACMEMESWRARLAVVFQDSHLLNRTIAENIAFGRTHASDAEIEAYAREVGIHDVVLKLPQGYETVVDEGGGSLSGGQRQRIAVARALMRKPDLVLLDEPTSALDAEGEAAVRAAILRMRQGRSMLIIAHRLSTVALADRVVLLEGGKVVEQGRLVDLLAGSARVRSLFGLGYPTSS